jgi:hypothetical protein
MAAAIELGRSHKVAVPGLEEQGPDHVRCVTRGFFSAFDSSFALAQRALFSPSLGFERQDSTVLR